MWSSGGFGIRFTTNLSDHALVQPSRHRMLSNSKYVGIWKKFPTGEVFKIGFPISMQILGF
jgi:hypothetical protein